MDDVLDIALCQIAGGVVHHPKRAAVVVSGPFLHAASDPAQANVVGGEPVEVGDHRLDTDRARRIGEGAGKAHLLVDAVFGSQQHGQERHVRRRRNEAYSAVLLRVRRCAGGEACDESNRGNRSFRLKRRPDRAKRIMVCRLRGQMQRCAERRPVRQTSKSRANLGQDRRRRPEAGIAF